MARRRGRRGGSGLTPATVAVEEVRRADQRRRFHELGRVLFAGEPRWAPVLRGYEVWLFERRHPYRQRADVTRFLARRAGDVVGRICAHHEPGAAEGWFGAFECADDEAAAHALVEAAADWVRARGARSIAGPATFTLADDVGVLVEGHEHAGGTARPWHPPYYAAHLAAAGLETLDRSFPRWRLGTGGAPTPDLAPDPVLPPHAGRLQDRRLALTGAAGSIAAVPDVSAASRLTSFREARRRAAAPTEAAVVRLEGAPASLVPGLLAAAGAAGYSGVWAPWSPVAGAPPDTVHRILGRVVA